MIGGVIFCEGMPGRRVVEKKSLTKNTANTPKLLDTNRWPEMIEATGTAAPQTFGRGGNARKGATRHRKVGTKDTFAGAPVRLTK